MTNRHTITISDITQVNRALNWADKLIGKGLPGGPVVMSLGREEDEDRSGPQNSKIHPMYHDLRTQAIIKIPGKIVVLAGYTEEDAKTLLVRWFAKDCELNGEPLRNPGRTIVCPITLENIYSRPSTKQFSKKEMSSHIEWLYALGSECRIRWSEKSLECYQEYRQANAKA